MNEKQNEIEQNKQNETIMETRDTKRKIKETEQEKRRVRIRCPDMKEAKRTAKNEK